MSILTKSHASGSCQQCFRCIHEALPHLPPASALCVVHKLSDITGNNTGGVPLS